MNRYLSILLLAAAASLTACGGGSGGGGPINPPTPLYTPCPAGYTGTAPNCVAPTNATASGKLVDDPSGNPLAGVQVGLAPWTADATPMPEGTTAPDGTFSFTAAPGHYLLVIGSNAPTDLNRPTIHDNITLVAGANALKAPTLPPVPTVTPAAAETGGSYRLVTIDANNEAPCFTAYNNARVSHGLAQVVVDEWLMENARAANTYYQSPSYQPGAAWPGNPYGFLTTGNDTFRGYVTKAGESFCQANLVDGAFNNNGPQWSESPHNLWVGATAIDIPSNQGSDSGVLEYPWDPRYQADPNVPNWP